MTLKRTRLLGCVRFVFYSGILRTAPLWVHIIRAVSAKQNKGQRQYPRREFSSESRRGYCSNNIRFIITAVLQSSVPCQSANIADNKHKIIIAQLLQLLDRRLQQCRIVNWCIKKLTRRYTEIIAYLQKFCQRRERLARWNVINITPAMTEVIAHLIFRDALLQTKLRDSIPYKVCINHSAHLPGSCYIVKQNRESIF